jgi:hypothetical protein
MTEYQQGGFVHMNDHDQLAFSLRAQCFICGRGIEGSPYVPGEKVAHTLCLERTAVTGDPD